MQEVQSESGDGGSESSLNPEFGDARDFWKLYDDLANSKDRDLSEDLNGNLDTLTNALLELIVLRPDNNTLPPARLSPPFSPDPTSVAANCLLYASLCCSLFSAAGAVLGKEWLRHFDRKREVASLGDQARFRQKKLRGIQKWYFQETVQMLPYVLLLSLLFFFAGLVPYLLRVNKAVAGVVIAFSVCGVVFWGFTILSCVIDPLSPYQTSLTFFLHTLLRVDEKSTASVGTQDNPADSRRGSNNAGDAQQRQSTPSGGGPTQVARTGQLKDSARSGIPHSELARNRDKHVLDVETARNRDKHVLNAEAAGWLLTVTSKPEDLVVVAQNICRLEFDAGGVILRDAASWSRLLCHGLDALQRWRDRPNENNRLAAEYIGAAIRRLLMEEGPYGDRWREDEVRKHFHEKLFRSKTLENLPVLKSTLLGTTGVYSSEINAAEYDLRKCFLQMHAAKGTDLEWTILGGFVQVRDDDIILNLLAAFICARFEEESDGESKRVRRLLSIKSYDEKDLAMNLSNALAKQDKAFSDTTLREETHNALAKIYTAFFKRAKRFNREQASEPGLREGLHKFVQKLNERVPRGTSTSEWVESSMEAVLALQAFPIDDEICRAVCSALAYIVEEAQRKVRKIELQTFTRVTLEAISGEFPSTGLTSLGDNDVLIRHFASIMTGPDHDGWPEFFAKHPKVWVPAPDNARKHWSQNDFAPNILNAFKEKVDDKERESLASIIVHIASTESTEWCRQLMIDGALLEFAEQIVTGKNNDIGNGSNVIAAVLRPVAAVLAVLKQEIDWATDQMYRIVGGIAAALEPEDSGLLEEIKGEKYHKNDVDGLVTLIEEVSEQRKYKGNQDAQVKGALTKLRAIKKLDKQESVIPET
ncbi:hypothetical protein FRC04_006687 [Tulasnella sp. 424]|nr:hypothetical protein FRC04_006687 [Tulasnella sp. 424]